VEWGEYRIEDVLEWQSQKEIDPLKLEELKDETEIIYPFYGQATINNGIISYHQLTNKVLNNENGRPTILIHSNNQNIVYLETPFYLKDGHGATSVLQSEKLNKSNQMFVIASIDKVIKSKYSYNKKATKVELKNTVIKLPTKNDMVDFEFMKSFIAELEAELIAELEAYLLATGLKDYTLTDEEQQVLEDFENVKFEEFNVVDLFNVKNSGNILSRDIVENSGGIPYLCASTENNAVVSYISYDEKYLDKGNCVFIGGKTFVVTYQEKDFYSNDSHNLVLYLKNEGKRSKLKQLYLATCINRSLGYKYSWGDSISNRKIQKDKVSLPVKNKQPNYTIMETFISAIQKLVIKEVVLYADRKIAATKTVVKK
jgi:Type I restriction modification DNA specificity domain